MSWLAATAVVSAALADAFSDALLDAGAVSVEVSDADAGTPFERAVFDEPFDGLSAGPGERPSLQWTRARVSALFDAGADVRAALGVALTVVGAAPDTAYDISRVEDEDWVRRTQSQFVPQQITSRLWVVPSWHRAPDAAAINIALDPGLAFGTGTHPTTRLCLRWLDATIRGGEIVIDFGSGSGILAIAALRLGAGSASGVDIDPQAVSAARENARRNDVAVTFVEAAEALPGAADLVVANILARPLIVLAPLLARLTREGGRLALSGILTEQQGEVKAAYSPWYDFDPAQEDEGWVLLSLRRSSSV